MNADLSELRIDKSKRGDELDPAVREKRRRWRALLIVAVLLALVAVAVRSFLFSPAIEVTLTTASLQSPAQGRAVLTASGYVVAQRKADVASKATGRLVYLGVVEGDQVQEDQILARVEDNDIRAQLNEARANLKLSEAELTEAENDFNRQKALFADGVIPRSVLEASETHYRRVLAAIELAKARIEEREVALENTRIRAPFDGTVLTKNADIGEVVAPLGAGSNTKAAVVTIADLSSLQVEADVSESNIEKIRIDQPAQITLDAYPTAAYDGYVAKIIPTADRSKGTVMVKVAFRDYDSRVLPEMSAKVIFLDERQAQTNADTQPVLTVSEEAVAQRAGRKIVYVVRDGRAAEVPVETGRSFDGYVEITSGLQSGDRVIDSLSDEIEDGAKVKPK